MTVLPSAQRKFESNDRVTVYLDNTDQWYTIHRRSTIYLWSRGRNDYEQRDRPLLVVEGIDGDNKNSAATYLALGSAGEPNVAGDTLFPTSQRFGADVGILDFADGGRDIAYNAQVTESAVRFFRDWRSRPTVGFSVAGVSMGGVVARYALADMEGRGETHGVAHFVSLDAPQQGAVVDSDLQNSIRSAVELTGAAVPSGLTSPAGKQLLTYAAFDTASPTAHQSFYQTLRGLNSSTGYPQQSDNIGVSFGTASRNTGERTAWVWFRTPGSLESYYLITGDIAQGGSMLPEDQANQWGPVLIAFSYELDREGLADPTFIPHTSALDLVNGVSAFDTTLSAQYARFHDRVPTEIVRPLLERMGYRTPPPPQPLVLTVNGPYHVPTNPGSWTASVNRTAPHGFTFAWRYRLDLTGCGPIDDDPPLRAASATTTASTAKKPGGGETNLINQCVWTNGPTSPTFSYSISADAWLDIEVTATNGTQSVTHLRRVRYGSYSGGGDDGPMAASPSTEGPLPDASIQADALTVDVFEVVGVRPSIVRPNGRAWVDYALPNASDVEIRVRDVLGRVHHQATEARPAGRHRSELAVSRLPAGLYLVTVRAGEAQRTARFVVQ